MGDGNFYSSADFPTSAFHNPELIAGGQLVGPANPEPVKAVDPAAFDSKQTIAPTEPDAEGYVAPRTVETRLVSKKKPGTKGSTQGKARRGKAASSGSRGAAGSDGRRSGGSRPRGKRTQGSRGGQRRRDSDSDNDRGDDGDPMKRAQSALARLGKMSGGKTSRGQRKQHRGDARSGMLDDVRLAEYDSAGARPSRNRTRGGTTDRHKGDGGRSGSHKTGAKSGGGGGGGGGGSKTHRRDSWTVVATGREREQLKKKTILDQDSVPDVDDSSDDEDDAGGSVPGIKRGADPELVSKWAAPRTSKKAFEAHLAAATVQMQVNQATKVAGGTEFVEVVGLKGEAEKAKPDSKASDTKKAFDAALTKYMVDSAVKEVAKTKKSVGKKSSSKPKT